MTAIHLPLTAALIQSLTPSTKETTVTASTTTVRRTPKESTMPSTLRKPKFPSRTQFLNRLDILSSKWGFAEAMRMNWMRVVSAHAPIQHPDYRTTTREASFPAVGTALSDRLAAAKPLAQRTYRTTVPAADLAVLAAL